MYAFFFIGKKNKTKQNKKKDDRNQEKLNTTIICFFCIHIKTKKKNK